MASRKRTLAEIVADFPKHEFSEDDDDATAEEQEEAEIRDELAKARREIWLHRNTKRKVDAGSAVCPTFLFDAVLVLVLTCHDENVTVTQYDIKNLCIRQCVKRKLASVAHVGVEADGHDGILWIDA